jgi:hypothetical protein
MSSADRGACAAASGKLGRISGVIVLWLVLAVGALPAAVSAAPRAAAGPDLAGKLFTIAGALRWIGPSGGTPLAATTPLTDPAVAVTSSGDFLVADPLRDRVLRVGLDGTVSVVAGNGKDGFSGDGGPATRASLSIPSDVAALPDGGFLIDDQSNERIRRVWPDGHISTVAGNGVFAYSGDGGPATSASLFDPYAVRRFPMVGS